MASINYLEYALGLDPTVSDSAFDALVVEEAGFSVDFIRRKLDSGKAVLEWSPDLQGPWTTGGITEVVTDNGEFEEVTATLPMDLEKKFVRFRVGQ